MPDTWTESDLRGAELPATGATYKTLVWDWIASRDQLVCELRRRREQDGVGYLQLAEETGLPLSTIRDYCTYRTRETHDA